MRRQGDDASAATARSRAQRMGSGGGGRGKATAGRGDMPDGRRDTHTNKAEPMVFHATVAVVKAGQVGPSCDLHIFGLVVQEADGHRLRVRLHKTLPMAVRQNWAASTTGTISTSPDNHACESKTVAHPSRTACRTRHSRNATMARLSSTMSASNSLSADPCDASVTLRGWSQTSPKHNIGKSLYPKQPLGLAQWQHSHSSWTQAQRPGSLSLAMSRWRLRSRRASRPMASCCCNWPADESPPWCRPLLCDLPWPFPPPPRPMAASAAVSGIVGFAETRLRTRTRRAAIGGGQGCVLPLPLLCVRAGLAPRGQRLPAAHGAALRRALTVVMCRMM